MSGHTPGPWRVWQDVTCPRIDGPETWVTDLDPDTSAADQRLIAASPEMAQALLDAAQLLEWVAEDGRKIGARITGSVIGRTAQVRHTIATVLLKAGVQP